MIVEWSESRLTSISRNQFESPIILGCWQSSDRNGTRTTCVFSSCLLASIIASLRTLSLNLDILKFLRRHFYIQDVPLGQCLHHFEFFLLSVPPWLFSTPNRTQHPLLPSFLPTLLPTFSFSSAFYSHRWYFQSRCCRAHEMKSRFPLIFLFDTLARVSRAVGLFEESTVLPRYWKLDDYLSERGE